MYTLFFSFGESLLTAIVPTFFGVSSTWTVLPGIIVGIASFVWSSRRVSKRVEAVTQKADQEMAKAETVSQRAGAKAPAVMLRSIDTSVNILKTGLIFRKWQFGVGTMLNARIGMLLFSKAMVHQQARQKSEVRSAYSASIPFLTASQVTGKKARLLHALWPAWAMLAVAHYRTDKGIEGAISGISKAGDNVLFLVQVTVDGAGMQFDIGEFCGESRDAFGRGNEADDGNSLDSPTLEPMDDRSQCSSGREHGVKHDGEIRGAILRDFTVVTFGLGSLLIPNHAKMPNLRFRE